MDLVPVSGLAWVQGSECRDAWEHLVLLLFVARVESPQSQQFLYSRQQGLKYKLQTSKAEKTCRNPTSPQVVEIIEILLHPLLKRPSGRLGDESEHKAWKEHLGDSLIPCHGG